MTLTYKHDLYRRAEDEPLYQCLGQRSIHSKVVVRTQTRIDMIIHTSDPLLYDATKVVRKYIVVAKMQNNDRAGLPTVANMNVLYC